MSEQKIPMWLRKPSHKKEVVATEKGWVVKETGEVLTRVPGLPQKIAEYFGGGLEVLSTPTVVEEATPVEPLNVEVTLVEEPTVETITTEEVQQTEVEHETTTEEVEEEEQAPVEEINKEEAQPKRRGRPAKAK